MNRNLRYVAFIDILGFRNIVKQFKGRVADLGTELSNIFRAAIFAALTGENVNIENLPSETELPQVVKFYQFSDSVILYTDDHKAESFIVSSVSSTSYYPDTYYRGFLFAAHWLKMNCMRSHLS
ncbi:hypothetical protein BP422_09750 [Brevibacillus formosus]|uniref:Uncharacterized protein n=1 Tax=Brevibacillus formosus TaxID=54913 RepID=A0A220MFL4_9BACL|nr:hypothetical protein [Brevibacillus formosus]ASJ53808.1 hypothetical protein BP422_09750 [Brevibacillus formosus]